MTDITQRISLSRPPLKRSMYKTLYMMDYKPYEEFQSQLPMMDLSKVKNKNLHLVHCLCNLILQKLQLETQLKKKEFERLVEKEPVKYAEEPICQEVEPPYPVKIHESLSSNQEAPLAFQQVEKDQEKYHLLSEPTAFQKREAESITPQRDTFAMPDFAISTDASTYQRDYKHWSSVRSGFYQANRNFSNFFFNDGYYNENPWTSEYMDTYNIFLKKLNRKTQNPVSTFCSTVRPIPSLSPEISTQTPIAVNTAL
ncbi:Jem1, partial [Ophiophagus hannah]